MGGGGCVYIINSVWLNIVFDPNDLDCGQNQTFFKNVFMFAKDKKAIKVCIMGYDGGKNYFKALCSLIKKISLPQVILYHLQNFRDGNNNIRC